MSGVVLHLPRRCDCCGLRWRKLFDTFVNGVGWQLYCAGCADPRDGGGPRPYLGPYPTKAAWPTLRLVHDAGAAPL